MRTNWQSGGLLVAVSSLVLISLVGCINPVAQDDPPLTVVNQPPDIDVVESIGGVIDSRIDLDAEATDPEGEPLTVLWSVVSQPSGSALTTGTIGDGATLSAYFTPTHTGVYEFDLVVSDGNSDVTVRVTVTVTSGPPESPSVTSPGNAATSVAVSANLQWSAAGASSYTVYLSTTPFTSSSLPAPAASDQVAASFDPPGSLQFNTTYYWAIAAKNADGITTGDVWSFTTIVEKPAAATLVSPANGDHIAGRTVSFDWDSAARATDYTLHLDPASAGSYTAYSGSGTGASESGLVDGAYSWWVTASNAGGTTQSAISTFVVDTVAPSLSITGGPTGATNDSTPTFSFVSGSDAVSVECRINSGSWVSCSEPNWTAPSLSDGNYTFWVRALDAAGNTRNRSRSFTVDTVSPSAPLLFSTPRSVEYHLATAEYSFGNLLIPGFPPPSVTYECSFYRTDTFQIGLWQSCSSPISYSVGFPRSYRFRVRAVDTAGNKSSSSTHDFDNRVLY